MASERIVAVGFLTERDLGKLVSGFTRHFSVPDDGMFDELIARLDRVTAERLDQGVVLRPERPE